MNRLGPTQRPNGKAQGTQRWHRLLFSHWEVDATALQPLVHRRLSIDTFEGRAFLGVVAFTMQHVTPFRWAPRVPTATTFYEINVRTYVHLDGEHPGIFFFSLDASSTLAVLAARALWRLPYFMSTMTLDDTGDRLKWSCERHWPKPTVQKWSADFDVGAALPPSREGTLEFFLAERYQLYVAGAGGRLRRGRVHHVPYPLDAVPRSEVSPALVSGLGATLGPRTADFFCPGVDVEVFPLEDVP